MQVRSPMVGIYGVIAGIFGIMLAALFWGLTRETVLFLTFSGFAVLVIVLSVLFNVRHIAGLRRKGIYPRQGLALESDVQRLLNEGYPAEAIRCYRELSGCDLRTAKAYVDDLLAQAEKNTQDEINEAEKS